MEDDDALSGLPPAERAQVSALLAERGEDDEPAAEARVGFVRRMIRAVLMMVTLVVACATGWHAVALASRPDVPFDGVHAPIALTIGFGLLGILLLWWFDGRWQWLPLALLGLGALAVSGLSMRWVDSSRTGVHEYWAGWQRGAVRLAGASCYRIDAEAFALRGADRAIFVYQRGIWPGAHSEAEFKRYFFSDLPMQVRADGWNCIAR